jgi:hypothetical protein
VVVDDFVEDVDKIVGRTTSRKNNKLPGDERLGLRSLAVVNMRETHSEEQIQ